MNVLDDVGPKQGVVAPGASTDDATPTLAGTGVPGHVVTVLDGETVLGSATVDIDGHWSVTPASPLADGEHVFSATQTGPDTLESAPNEPIRIVVDTVPPAAPCAWIDGAANDAGLVNTDKPVVCGTGEPGNTITVRYPDGQQVTTIVDDDGNWRAPPPDAPLPDGCGTIVVTECDPAGNAGCAEIPLNVDTQAPDTPRIDALIDDAGQRTGPIAPGGVTDDARPDVLGRGTPGDTITVYDNGRQLGDVRVGANGKWRFTPGDDLAPGAHSLTVTATDPAGNVSGASEPFAFDLDCTPFETLQPSITAVHDDVGPLTGNVAPGGVTDDTRPTIHGTGRALSTISVYDGATLLGTTLADGAGQWTFTPAPGLADGEHNVTAIAQDRAGNVSGPAAPFSFCVDSVAPAAPTIVAALDDVGAVQGALASGAVTDDRSPTLTGSAEPGSRVSIYDNGAKSGDATADATGHWRYTPATPLSEGAHAFTATATDAAGNTSPPSQPFDLTTDCTPPRASITIDAIATDSGVSASDFVTGDNTLIFTGSLGQPLAGGEHVQVSVDGGQTWQGAALSPSGAQWTWDNTANALADGEYDVRARVVDAAGNVGHAAQQCVVIDTQPPCQTVSIDCYVDDVGAQTGSFGSGTTTDDRSPLLKGALSAPLAVGEAVHVYEGATLVGIASVEASGRAWTLALDGLQAGSHHVYIARVVDAAGNAGARSDAFAFDVRLQVSVDAQTTLDTTPIITGATSFSHQPGESMQVTVNGVTYRSQDGAVVVDARNGRWYLQIPERDALDAGSYDVSAVMLDGHGAVIARDATACELVIAPAPVACFGAAGSVDNKATAITLGGDGQWQIYSNQVVFDGRGTSGASLGQYTATVLVPSTTKLAGRNETHSATFADLDRNGTMDIVGEDAKFADGQQAWLFDGTTYRPVQIGLNETAAGNAANGTTNHPAANVYASYGGVAVFDANGDGLPDIVYGARVANNAATTGGANSQFVHNTNGTLAGFAKNSAYAYGPLHGQPVKEVSSVDLDNDGAVDIVYHAREGASTAGGRSSENCYRLVVASSDGNGGLRSSQIVNYVFDNQYGTAQAAHAPSMTWADFNRDGYMDLFLGTSYGERAASTIYFNDGNGRLSSTNVSAIGTPTHTYAMNDTLTGGPSVALDWNGDGRMDVMEAPQFGSTGTLNLYTNLTAGGVVKFATSRLQADGSFGMGACVALGGDVASGRAVTGIVKLDFDWDGAQDLLVFTAGGHSTYVHNPNAIEHGTSLHLRIVDQNGINAFYGNTVQLVDARGAVVATQIINPQSGNQTNDSTGIVDFHGLDPNGTYSAVLLRNVGGVSSDVGGVASVAANAIEHVNGAWSGLAPGAANHAYVLTAAGALGASDVNAWSGRAGGGADLVGTGYNDTFVAQTGTAVYDGAGGATTVSGQGVWSSTGGLDVVDYKLAGATSLSIDLNQTGAQFTGYNTATFRNVEGIAGAAGDDRFVGNAADNLFEGRGGSDCFDLQSGGRDTLVYRVSSAADATGGNGADIVNGFHVGLWEASTNADRLDVSSLLIGYRPAGGACCADGAAALDASGHIADYLRTTTSDGNTLVSIDRDGAGGAFGWTPLAVLNGVETDLATLLANHQIA